MGKDSVESFAVGKPQEIDAKQRKRMQSSCSERSDAKTAGCSVRLFGLAERDYGGYPRIEVAPLQGAYFVLTQTTKGKLFALALVALWIYSAIFSQNLLRYAATSARVTDSVRS